MPGFFNVPTVTEANLSAGPGRVYLGASGDTPTVDVGAIAEDGGVSAVYKSVKGELRQGNPSVRVFKFNKMQDMGIKLTGVEWNFTTLSYALGAGLTATAASSETMDFGGDPTVDTVAIHAQHQMLNGQTMNLYAWKASSAVDEIEIKLGQDLHTFPYEFDPHRVTTFWSGTATAGNDQLCRLYRQTA